MMDANAAICLIITSELSHFQCRLSGRNGAALLEDVQEFCGSARKSKVFEHTLMREGGNGCGG